jgi:hypothetical protein
MTPPMMGADSAELRGRLEAARNEKQRLEKSASTTRGRLVVTVLDSPLGKLPRAVGVLATQYARALKQVKDAAEHMRAIVDQMPAEESAEVARRARLSALVARYVAGLELVAAPDPIYRWRVVKPDGRHVPVGNYATDRCAMLQAIEKGGGVMTMNMVAGAYFQELSHIGGRGSLPIPSEMSIVCALMFPPAETIARIALECAGVDPDTAVPPVLAE